MPATSKYERTLKDQFRIVNTPILRLLEELSNPERPTFIGETADNEEIILEKGDVIAFPPTENPTFLLVITIYESTGFVFYSLTEDTYRFYESKQFIAEYEEHEITILNNPYGVTRGESSYSSGNESIEQSPKEELLAKYSEVDIPHMEELPANQVAGLYIECINEELKPGDVFMVNDEFRFVLNIEQDKEAYINADDIGVINYNLTKNHFSFYPVGLFETDNEANKLTVISDPWNIRN